MNEEWMHSGDSQPTMTGSDWQSLVNRMNWRRVINIPVIRMNRRVIYIPGHGATKTSHCHCHQSL